MKAIRPELSLKEKDVLAFIREFISANGYSPSTREVMDGCYLSSTSVADYTLGLLERRGLIRRAPMVSRSIVVLDACPYCHRMWGEDPAFGDNSKCSAPMHP